LFRSGDSEYLLNGKLCRLRDIQELFMGTGLGPESYALIEQGRIGQILSSRPTDRRAIIEEAAGITKFKTKKRLAEARLEDAKTESEPRQRHLRRSHAPDELAQAPGQQGRALRQAARRDARQAARRARQQVHPDGSGKRRARYPDQSTGRRDSPADRSVQQSEAEHSERTQRGYAIETETRQNRERLNQIALEGDRGKRASAPTKSAAPN
jgi:chromosome segregation protein